MGKQPNSGKHQLNQQQDNLKRMPLKRQPTSPKKKKPAATTTTFQYFYAQEELKKFYAEEALQRAMSQPLRSQTLSGLRSNQPQTRSGYSGLSQWVGNMPSFTPPTQAGGGSMAAPKFKKGDVVIATVDIDRGAIKGTKALVLQYNAGGNLLEIDFNTFNPGWATSYWSPVSKWTLADDNGDVAVPHVKVSFDSVIIEDHKRQQILEALEQVNQQKLIFTTWGFGDTIEKGKGVSMLFYGPPGTGKTLMAQAIADHLDKKLKVISTADIESSAPGEAERNIIKHFKEAGKDTVLLFDECDSLIYSRKYVGAIMGAQINQLLSSLEKYDGVTLFTTNRLGTLDEAVNRRLALKLEFEIPDRPQRALIWQRMFPKKAPLDADIDWDKLAVVEIAGGYIKNAVLRAARMAAIEKIPDKQKKIKMEHLVKSLKLEAESMIEFEKATDKHHEGYGHVGADGVVHRGRERVSGGLENG